MLHKAEQFRFESSIFRVLAPALCACLLLLTFAVSPRTTRAQEGTGAQPPTPRPRTKRVMPLRKSDSAQGSRVTITSDGGALSDYSAYRSGDRFIVVIPQAEAAGGGGGVSGRGFEGAQVSRRGNDLVYTFKLEPGATARVNQRFNQLDVQFTAQKPAATTSSAANATPAATPTPRPTRTPAELAGTASPTPSVRATPDTTRLVQTDPNAQAGVVPPTGTSVPTPAPADVSPGFPGFTPSPEMTPTVAPTVEQIAQVLPTPAAPASAVTTSAPAAGRTLGATVVNNWPWLLAALLAVGVALLFVGRLGSRRENELPPVADTAPALTERPAAKPVKAAPAAAPIKPGTKAAAVAPVAKVAPLVTPVPVVAKEAKPEKPATAVKPKKQTKAERRREKQLKAAAEKRAASVGTTAAGEVSVEKATVAAAEVVAAKSGVTPDETPVDKPDVVAVKADVPVSVPLPAHKQAEEKGIVLAAADAEVAGAEVQKLLAGESYAEAVIGASDSATRQLVAAELSAALAGRNAERNERARAAFLKHGYFEDAAGDLQTAEAPAQRAAAALSLALLHDRAATPHLVAALEDPSPDVRRASIEALSQLKDPAACAPLEALRWRERSRQVPQSLIRHAIEACTPAEADADATSVTDDETITQEAVSVPPMAAEAPSAVAETVEATAIEAPSIETPAVETATIETATADTAVDDIPVTFVDEAVDEAAPAETQLSETPTLEAVPVHSPTFEPETGEVVAAPQSFVAEARDVVPTDVESSVVDLDVVSPPADEPSMVETQPVESLWAGAVEDTSAESVADVSTAGQSLEEAGVVYTFDEAEAEEWAALRHRGDGAETSAHAADFASVSAQDEKAADAEAAAHVYAAPEFAVSRDAESAADDWIDVEEPEADELVVPDSFASQATLDELVTVEAEASSAPHEQTPDEAPVDATSEARPTLLRPKTAAETSIDLAPEVKGVELAEEESVELTPEKSLVEWSATSSQSSFVEPEIETESPLDLVGAAPLGIALVEEEAEIAPARGLAGLDDVEVDARVGQRGLAAQDAEVDELSIIPKAIQLRLDSPDAAERAESVRALAHLNTDEAYKQICDAFDDRDGGVREAAARALYEVADDRAESFTRALREAGPARRRNIGAALASSGLAGEAVSQLTGESRDRTYDAFSLLFLMAKAGETVPLIQAIESHPDNEVRLAVVKLLALSGQQDVLPSFRRLAVRGSLPAEVRSAVMEAIYQISSSNAPAAPNRAR